MTTLATGPPENRPYADGAMAGRPSTRKAPPLGKKIAALRQQRGLTQAQLADALGVRQQVVAYYEKRAENPSLELIQRLAKFFDVDPRDLIDDAVKELKPARKKPGPPSELELRLERLRTLPRSKQELILAILDAALEQAGARLRAPA
jgi:transcriptional regulator with XRE-family HTH domain